jgi:hypothetical protein
MKGTTMSKRLVNTPKSKRYKYDKRLSEFANEIAEHLNDLGYKITLEPAKGDGPEYVFSGSHPTRFSVMVRIFPTISYLQAYVIKFDKRLMNDLGFYKLLLSSVIDTHATTVIPTLREENKDKFVKLNYSMAFQMYERQLFSHLLDYFDSDVKYVNDKVYEYQLKFLKKLDREKKKKAK